MRNLIKIPFSLPQAEKALAVYLQLFLQIKTGHVDFSEGEFLMVYYIHLLCLVSAPLHAELVNIFKRGKLSLLLNQWLFQTTLNFTLNAGEIVRESYKSSNFIQPQNTESLKTRK